MVVNLLFLVLFIALAVLCGWLTWRAIRARRLWVKIAGGLGAGLLTVLFAALALTGGRGIAATYFPGAPAAPDLTVAGTPEQIARGDYLVNLSCIGCHGAVGPDGNPTEQQPLTGGWNIAAAEGFGFMSDMVTENLTPGGKLASYSDGEIFRALRHSINNQGTKLGFMDFLPYKELSDDDTQAIIAYLRSDARELQPSEKVQPAPQPSFLVKLLCRIAFKPLPYPDKTIEAPPITDKVAYGRYLVTSKIDCYSCHSEDFKTMNIEEPEKSGGYLGGGNPMLSPEDGKTVVYSANLTMDKETGIGNWTEEEFIKAVRFGQRPDGKPLRQPMEPFSALSDEEVSAIWAYLQTAPPIRNEVARNWGE